MSESPTPTPGLTRDESPTHNEKLVEFRQRYVETMDGVKALLRAAVLLPGDPAPQVAAAQRMGVVSPTAALVAVVNSLATWLRAEACDSPELSSDLLDGVFREWDDLLEQVDADLADLADPPAALGLGVAT